MNFEKKIMLKEFFLALFNKRHIFGQKIIPSTILISL